MSDMLSQDEINALLGNGSFESNELSNEQKDILGEVGNISMGTAATTLSTLVGRKVDISTPEVNIISIKDELSTKYDRPCVGLRIDYKEGIVGSNILILKQEDTKIIASLMMGGDGTIDTESPLSELELSAISEAMNQMVGSSSTSLSSMLKYKIDIDTPQAFILNFEDDSFFEKINLGDDRVVCNTFKMTVEGLIDSEIMQMLPLDFAEGIISTLTNSTEVSSNSPEPTPISQPSNVQPQTQTQTQTTTQNSYDNMQQPMMMQQPQSAFNPSNVDVKQVQFQNFDTTAFIQQKENIGIIQDVPLEVTVELGRSKKPIREILEFNPGTIIELDKIAGEPIDILVNGKFIAKGEVVVIDENFGVRVTDIINVNERI